MIQGRGWVDSREEGGMIQGRGWDDSREEVGMNQPTLLG